MSDGHCLVCMNFSKETYRLHDIFGLQEKPCGARCCNKCTSLLLVYNTNGKCPWCRKTLWEPDRRLLRLKKTVDEQTLQLQVYKEALDSWNHLFAELNDVHNAISVVVASRETVRHKISESMEYFVMVASVIFVCTTWATIIISVA